jgi:hypothetical protein
MNIWIKLILLLLLFAVVIYMLAALPMYYFQKKQVRAFRRLAQEFKFKEDIPKPRLRPIFPKISGVYNDVYIVVHMAQHKHTTRTVGKTRVRGWFLKIATAVKTPNTATLNIMNKKSIKEDISLNEFYSYFNIGNQTQENIDRIFTNEIKTEIINIVKKHKFIHIKLEKEVLYISYLKGLYKEKDVEFCVDNIKLLVRLAKQM